jgi:hypothetical protein
VRDMKKAQEQAGGVIRFSTGFLVPMRVGAGRANAPL